MDETQQLFLEATLTPANAEKTGKEWDVTIIGAKEPGDLVTVEGAQYIRSKNGRLYSLNAIKESAQQWDGVKVYDNHLTQKEFEQKQGMRSPVKEWLGTIVQPYWDDKAKQLRGTFKVVEDTLAGKLKNAWEQGVLSSIGLSIDTFPIVGREAMFEGNRTPIIEGFKKILSVDLVGDPAAGGGFNRLIAATQPKMEDIIMDEEKVQAMIDKAIGETVGDTVKTALAEALAAEAELLEAEETETAQEMAKPHGKKKKKGGADEEEDEDMDYTEAKGDPEDDTQSKVVAEALHQVKLTECRLLLRDSLDASKLPVEFRAPIEKMFEGKVFGKKELEAVINAQKAAQAAQDPSGRATEGATERGSVQAGLSPEDKLEVALMQHVWGKHSLVGVDQSDDLVVKERLLESDAYGSWVRDGKQNVGNYYRLSEIIRGFFDGRDPLLDDYNAQEAVALTSAIKNAVNIFLANDYSKREAWYESIVNIEEVTTIDQATLVREYGVATLDEVPAGSAYTELNLSDDEETAAFVKRGNYIGVTLEDLMKDKIQAFRRIPRVLSNAWYNTLSDLVANVFTVNTAAGPVLADTGALFNATAATSAGGHANLLTAALSFTAYSAARTAMRKQTDRDLGVGRRLEINPRFLLVPEDLETTGNIIRNSQQLPGSANNDVNPFFQQFEVMTVPSWTDTNNWALVGDPRMFPAIYLIFPRGMRVPSIFTADSEVAGAMFTNDEIRYKVRQMTYRFSATYDCAPVSDFRPLHKSNVA